MSAYGIAVVLYLLIEKVSDSPKLFDPCVVTYSKPLDIPIRSQNKNNVRKVT